MAELIIYYVLNSKKSLIWMVTGSSPNYKWSFFHDKVLLLELVNNFLIVGNLKLSKSYVVLSPKVSNAPSRNLLFGMKGENWLLMVKFSMKNP